MSYLFGRAIVKKIINKNLKTKPLQLAASISSITNEGIVTIAFNKDIYVIQNLTAIDS
jgi:membrane protein DedA with SNARE-associated domain